MSCCTRGTTAGARAVMNNDPGPIMGTWDFKWPEGTPIRVAFQTPPNVSPMDFQNAKAIISQLAQRWHHPNSTLTFTFGLPDFGVPVVKNGERHPQQRSDVASDTWREYDVLVSLEPLPLTRTDTVGGRAERIFLPQSEMGSYARRIDFGTPTMYLGPMPGYQGSLADYYGPAAGPLSPEQSLAQMMVVHEFGHALGLAHEHQNPEARQALNLNSSSYDLGKARQILISRFGVPAGELPVGTAATDEFLAAHLGDEWPGNKHFSDWRPYATGAPINSIMSVAYHDCALVTDDGCGGGPTCPLMAILTAPTQGDFAALTAMYT